MKRLIIILSVLLSSVIAFAVPPQLAVEQLFDGRYNEDKTVSTSIYKNNGNYYRGMTVKNNPEIVKTMSEAIAKDWPKASEFSDHIGDNGRYTSLTIINNGEKISIGLKSNSKTGTTFFFVQGKEKAFK